MSPHYGLWLTKVTKLTHYIRTHNTEQNVYRCYNQDHKDIKILLNSLHTCYPNIKLWHRTRVRAQWFELITLKFIDKRRQYLFQDILIVYPCSIFVFYEIIHNIYIKNDTYFHIYLIFSFFLIEFSRIEKLIQLFGTSKCPNLQKMKRYI